MKLFDNEPIVTIPTFGRERYEFIRGNNKTYKTLLEEAFRVYPASKRKIFSHRFRSNRKDDQFRNNCFELITFFNLQKIFTTWVLSESNTEKPDFYCPSLKTYFETTVLHNKSTKKVRLKELFEELNQIHSNFQFKDFKATINTNQNPKYSLIKKEIIANLRNKDPHVIINLEGVRIEFIKERKRLSEQDNIVSHFSMIGGADLEKQNSDLLKTLKSKIKEKDSKYKRLRKRKLFGLIISLPDEFSFKSYSQLMNSLKHSLKLKSDIYIFNLRGKYYVYDNTERISKLTIEKILVTFQDR